MGRWGSANGCSWNFPKDYFKDHPKTWFCQWLITMVIVFVFSGVVGPLPLHGHTWPICKLAYTWEWSEPQKPEMILQVLSHRFFQAPNLSQAIFFLHGLLKGGDEGFLRKLVKKLIWDVSENRGKTPQNGWFIMENPIKMGMIWGYPYFWKHPGNTHVYNLEVQDQTKNGLSEDPREGFPTAKGQSWIFGLPGIFTSVLYQLPKCLVTITIPFLENTSRNIAGEAPQQPPLQLPLQAGPHKQWKVDLFRGWNATQLTWELYGIFIHVKWAGATSEALFMPKMRNLGFFFAHQSVSNPGHDIPWKYWLVQVPHPWNGFF